MNDPESGVDIDLELIRNTFRPICTVEGKLGQGAMGAVYRAKWREQDCALKVLLPQALADPSSLRRFMLEGEILKSLDHPNILKVHEVGKNGDWPYMLSELVSGGNMDEELQRGPLNWIQALGVCESVLEALVVVHQREIFHRDIKPSNLLKATDGTVKLADFGIAKADGMALKKTSTGLILGTPAYIAPELLRGREADARADLYSLGVVLYEMLCGQIPWDVTEGSDLLTARFTHDVLPVSSRLSGIPRSIDSLVDSAMAVEIVDRYPSASTFLLALRTTRERLMGTKPKDQTAVTALADVQRLPQPGVPNRGGTISRPLSSTGRSLSSPRASPSRNTGQSRTFPQKPAAPLATGALAACLVAGLGLLTVGGLIAIRLKSSPAPVQTWSPDGASVVITLSPEQQQRAEKIRFLLITDPQSRLAANEISKISRQEPKLSAPLLYEIWHSTAGVAQRTVAVALMDTQQGLAVPAIAYLLAEARTNNDDVRTRAAANLLVIVHDCEARSCPDGSMVVGVLGSVLRGAWAEGREERKEVVLAAIRTIGWLGREDTSDDTVDALRKVTGRVDWQASASGPDADHEILQALQLIPTAKARKECAALRQLMHH